MTTAEDKARRARVILDDDVFKEAVENTRQYFRNEFEHSQPTEGDRREAAYYSMRGFDMFMAELQNFVDELRVAPKR